MNSRKTVFITGANRGIGKEIFTSFVNSKFNVICTVRKRTTEFDNFILKFKKVKNQFIRIIEFDIDDHSKVKSEVQKLYKEKIILDVLVNNAGKADGGLFEMTPISKIKEIFETNFFSQLHLIQLLLRLIKKSESGTIINIGSISGILSEPGTISYGASKASLMFSSKVMANELSRYNIRVNSIAPSITDTNMAKEMDKKSMEKLINKSYLKRRCSPKDISNLVLFLCSDESKNINGQILRIDGGISG